MHLGPARWFQRLSVYAGDCVGKGDVCLAHCLVILGEGDKTLAECAKSVNQMLSACGALQSLAAQKSRLTAAMAKVALDACNDCEKACKPHASRHAECKACMEACIECAKECRSFAA